MNKIESARTLTIKELTVVLEDKISGYLTQLDDFAHTYNIACILKTDADDALNNMKRVALELQPVIYAIDKQQTRYSELIRALVSETK